MRNLPDRDTFPRANGAANEQVAEIPALLDVLKARIEALSERQAKLHSRLSPVLGKSIPSETSAPVAEARTAVGEVLAQQIARITTMIDDVFATESALAL